MSKSLSAARVKAMRTLSLDITLAYVVISGGWVGSMTTTHIPGFVLKGAYLDVRDDVTMDLLIARWSVGSCLQNLEGNHDSIHLFLESVLPEGGTHISVDLEGMLDCTRELDAIILGCPEVSLLHGFEDPPCTPKGMRDSP
jgi:hypothetical protein